MSDKQLWLCVPKPADGEFFAREIDGLKVLYGADIVLALVSDGYRLDARLTRPPENEKPCVKLYGVGRYPYSVELDRGGEWNAYAMEPHVVCGLPTSLRYLYGWRAESGLAAVAELMNAPIGDYLVPITPADLLRAIEAGDETVEERECFATIWGKVIA